MVLNETLLLFLREIEAGGALSEWLLQGVAIGS
jgi:hypothetical protein